MSEFSKKTRLKYNSGEVEWNQDEESRDLNEINTEEARTFERRKNSGIIPIWVCNYKHTYRVRSYYELADHIRNHATDGNVFESVITSSHFRRKCSITNPQKSFEIFFNKYCHCQFMCKHCRIQSMDKEYIINHLMDDNLFYCSYCCYHSPYPYMINLHFHVCPLRGIARAFRLLYPEI